MASTVGFLSPMNNASQKNENAGFWQRPGQYHIANFPVGDIATPPVEQLLGVNNPNIAVGFFTDANGLTFGYQVNINTGKFQADIVDPNAPGAKPDRRRDQQPRRHRGLHAHPANGNTDGFLRSGTARSPTWPSPARQPPWRLGVHDCDEVVGTYTVGSGSSAVMHGFTLDARRRLHLG